MRRALALVVLAAAFPSAAPGAKPAPPTPPPPPPSAPKDAAVTSVTANAISLRWTAAKDAKAPVTYGVYRDDARVLSTSATTATVDGLVCAHSYKLGVDTVDATGTRSKQQTTLSVQTAACPRERPGPKTPKALAVTGVTTTSVSLAWWYGRVNDGSGSDGSGSRAAVGYGVYRDGVLVLSTTTLAATLTGLQCEHAYLLAVDAVDASGKRSKKQATVRATTAACPDVTPPTVPARLAVSAATAENISIGWAPSTDNVGVQSYSLFVDGKPAGTTAAPLATFSGLACGHTYVLGVAAIDAAGNTSPRAEISASTAPCSTDLHVAPNGADFGWSFISTVYDGTSVRLYVDGKLAATKPVSGAIEHSTGDLRIGGNSIWGEWFKGKIDNVRVYDRALSEPELSTDMGTAVTDGAVPGLVAAYTFDEGSGTGVADASRHGNSGTISNAAWAADGKFGGSLSFNGTNGSVRVPDSASLDLTGAMTLEAWVHPDELGGTWRTALVKEAGDHLDYALYANATDPADPAPTSGTPSGHVFIGADTSAKAPASLAPNDCRNALQPCLTIDRAYHAALPGQTITLAPGAYPEQTVTADPTKIAPRVVVAPAAPGTVTIDTINVHATHLEFRNLNLGLSFWNTFVDAQDVVFRDMVAGGFIISSSKDVSVFGGSYGPAVDTKSQVQPVPDNVEPENIRIEGAFFHDYTRVDPASHMECLQFGAGNGIVIRNNRFTNCNDFDLMMGIWGSVPDPRNILIENNVFDAATESLPTFGAYYSLMTGGWANQVIRNNTLLMPIAFQPFGTYVNVRAVGNLGPGTSWGCDGRVTYSHNVWLADGTDDPRCAPTDKSTTDLGLVDPTHLDVHLRADSPAIDAGDPSDYAPDDIGGRQRPLGAAPDAGAYEHG